MPTTLSWAIIACLVPPLHGGNIRTSKPQKLWGLCFYAVTDHGVLWNVITEFSKCRKWVSGGVTAWLNQFKKLVSDKIAKVEKDADKQRDPLLIDQAGSQPGAAAMAATRGHMHLAGTLWRKAFFEGMLHVLTRTAELYSPRKMDADATELTALGKVARAVKSAGVEWADSARLTRDYLAKLAKWAQAEINRQLTLASLRQKTNFDPAQLAFAVGIYHHLAASPRASHRSIARAVF